MRKLKVLSLFCGCGGMDLGMLGGFEYLGHPYPEHPFEIVKAYDNDPYCTKIYDENFSHKCDVADVREIEISNLPDIDILIGGFPCQSFSISAQNPPRLGYKDERGMLFFEMVKILKEKQPRFFIAENVKGLLSANKGQAFPMIIKEFEGAGYHVKFKLLNASEYGVPQKRERVIIVGCRESKDFENYRFPAPTTRFNKVPLSKVINPEDNLNERLFFSERAVAGMLLVRDKMNKGRVQNLDEPCNTISSHLAKVSLNSTDPVLLFENRYRRFSSTECARIQSFPEDFKWGSVSEAKQLKAIGNAVPPVMMWHIAKSLSEILNAKEKPHVDHVSTDFDWPQERMVQLTLFEPEILYITSLNREKLLLGSCRQGTIEWIKNNQLYNYPITDQELQDHPELLDVKKIIILHKNKMVGFYNVLDVDVVLKPELIGYGYPIKSSKRSMESKYILFTLSPEPQLDKDIPWYTFSPIIGKGLISPSNA
ncbi:MAG: DNA (cytosine-5-)-methyltransferase [Bacteroidales bacterium]|nr:DNA (cytosine-5-)-methyltransferase [Bacteroidales bacterium]